jgi:LysM repeat protein
LRLVTKDAVAFFGGRAMRVVTSRHAFQAAVIALALLVTSTNLNASAATAVSQDDIGEKSILEAVINADYVEDAHYMETIDVVPTVGVTYMNNGASAVALVDGGTTSDPVIEDEEGDYYRPDPFAFAVQPFTELYGEDGETVAAATGEEAESAVDKPEARHEIETYIVESGDSVGLIARKFGLTTSTILYANDLTARSVIQPGQKMTIPPVDGVVYQVRSGDTIGKIASRYSSDVDGIIKANGLSDSGFISIGLDLMIPGGKPPAAAPVRPPARIAASSISKVVSPAANASSSGTRLLWPTAARRITQYYKGSAHFGLDIAGPTGTHIYAAEDGVVLTSGWNSSGYGYMIVVDHGGGLYTRYGHFSRLLVSQGDTVQRGDVIGLMGSTGRSTGPHLHFEVLVGGLLNRRNPLDYIQ